VEHTPVTYSTFWVVEQGNAHVILNTQRQDREEAKRTAAKWLGGNPDQYKVTPITEPGDRVRIDVTIQV
jgi:hypothetical protein